MPSLQSKRGRALEGAQEGDEVGLLLAAQAQLEDQAEELDRVLQGGQPAVVQVRRAVLDAAQPEGLDRPVARLVREEALQLEVV